MNKALSGTKIYYVTVSALSVALLFLLTPMQRYFSYLASTTYHIIWVWMGIIYVAVLAALLGLSLCSSKRLPRRFRISAEGIKAALTLAAWAVEYFFYNVFSTVTIFCVVLFLTGFFANLAEPKGSNADKSKDS